MTIIVAMLTGVFTPAVFRVATAGLARLVEEVRGSMIVEHPPFMTEFRLAGDSGIYVASRSCCLRGLMGSLELMLFFSPRTFLPINV